MTADPDATGSRRRASADATTPTIALDGMGSARAPWEGLGSAPTPRRRRSAQVKIRPAPRRPAVARVFVTLGQRISLMWRPSVEPEVGVDPSEWVQATPTRYETARSFLPSRGLVLSMLVAIGAWAWVGACLLTIDPHAPYAVLTLLGGVTVGITAILAPPLRLLATRYGRTRAFREAAWWHGMRQGALVGLAVAANGFLLAFRQWAPVGSVAVGFGTLAVEGIILAVLLSARGRPDPRLR